MPTKRCSTCGINYPDIPYGEFQACHVCGEGLSFMSNADPHDDWADRVKSTVDLRESKSALQETPPRITVPIEILDDGGLFYVRQTDLYKAGLHILNTRSFVLFVANGIVWETQAWQEQERRWQIVPLLSWDKLNELEWDKVEPGEWVDDFLRAIEEGW